MIFIISFLKYCIFFSNMVFEQHIFMVKNPNKLFFLGILTLYISQKNQQDTHKCSNHREIKKLIFKDKQN